VAERALELVPDRRLPPLRNARREAERRHLERLTVVDADLHLPAGPDPDEVGRHLRHANLRRLLALGASGIGFRSWDTLVPAPREDPRVAGRVRLPAQALPTAGPDGRHPMAAALLDCLDSLGADYGIVSHAPLLYLAQHPDVEVETELARAFAGWFLEDVLPGSDRLRTLLYLPITDPQASVRMIEELAGRPGVAGFLITAVSELPLHRNEYMKVFAALDERAQPLAVHAAANWQERPFNLLERFVGAHALGTPFYGLVHLFNAVVAGLPERFPRIRWVWMEAGQSWATFAASRLDNEYRQRQSEAPLLTRLPSAYIREMHFTTQPFEDEFPAREARAFLDSLGGARRLLYSSGYPGPDFDTPARIFDLPYLTGEEKRAILGENALELFGLPRPGASAP
jgi:uncharacterized protein